MARLGLPERWLPLLGILKAAGAPGLLVGIGVPVIGTAAAAGGDPGNTHRSSNGQRQLC